MQVTIFKSQRNMSLIDTNEVQLSMPGDIKGNVSVP